MIENDDTIEAIARKALVSSMTNPAVSAAANRLAHQFAKREARRALRASIRPFALEEPPPRPADPMAAHVFFEVSTSEPPGPAPLPVVRGGAPLPRTTDERRRHAKEFFALIFKDATATLEDLAQSRIRIFYRLARELARHTRHLQESDLLAQLPIQDWTKPLRPQEVAGRFSRTSQLLRDGPDLALLPPAAPEDRTNYDPAEDPALAHYCAGLAVLAEDLGIHDGTRLEPYLGRYGLKGLLEPELVRLACPSPEEVLEWEEQLVQDTLKIVLARGVTGAHQWLNSTHGLQAREAQVLIKAANQEALKRNEGDIEEKRAVAQLRLEEIYRRSTKAMNLPAQLGTMKLLALVSGLARVEPEDAIQEFVTTVKRVSAEEQQAKQLTADEDEDTAA